MYFFFGGADRLDDEMTALMGRIVENVSFGLDALEREAERTAAGIAEGAHCAPAGRPGRHQRSDHAGNHARGAVPAGMRSGGAGRRFHLHGHCAGAPRQRVSAGGRGSGSRTGSRASISACPRMRIIRKDRALPASRCARARRASATTISPIFRWTATSTIAPRTVRPCRARHCR